MISSCEGQIIAGGRIHIITEGQAPTSCAPNPPMEPVSPANPGQQLVMPTRSPVYKANHPPGQLPLMCRVAPRAPPWSLYCQPSQDSHPSGHTRSTVKPATRQDSCLPCSQLCGSCTQVCPEPPHGACKTSRTRTATHHARKEPLGHQHSHAGQPPFKPTRSLVRAATHRDSWPTFPHKAL